MNGLWAYNYEAQYPVTSPHRRRLPHPDNFPPPDRGHYNQ